MFERFYQVDSSDTRARGGAGLGLSIAKAIIEGFGGSIGLTARRDERTTFWIELPRCDDNAGSEAKQTL